jgi:hypothetical protein
MPLRHHHAGHPVSRPDGGGPCCAGDGRQPNYVAACRVLNAEGATLNPLKVLQSLSDDMPLHLAHETLSRMLAGMEHRRRHCQVGPPTWHCTVGPVLAAGSWCTSARRVPVQWG